ncbi:MAG: methyltransferase domain-containing protein [Alphaproteobacteria bacterium]|jgi:SAM-dependent methyltransferase|nr:methyltransferase domain-containing protein [Alphaproteobacteria bacterium]MBT5860047.1 methyltransferase domain-containing protein [Alphaproteobacteria bacterium]
MNTPLTMAQMRATWDSAAPGWAKWEAKLAENLVDATEAMMDAANFSPGMRVLDIASGAGSQTLMAAKRVGDGGNVVASDISEEMLGHVQANADAAGLANIRTMHGAAEDFGEVNIPFDGAICRLGLMLFVAPGRALAGIKQALNPGARVSVLVFTVPQNNPFIAQSMGIAMKHAGKPPPPAGSPGLFALGGDGVLEALLTDNGYSDVKIKTVTATLKLASADEALEMMQQAFGAYRAVLAEMSPDDQAAAWAEIRGSLGQFEAADGFQADLELMIGSGAFNEA